MVEGGVGFDGFVVVLGGEGVAMVVVVRIGPALREVGKMAVGWSMW